MPFLLMFRISGRLVIYFTEHYYQVLTSFIKGSKIYKRFEGKKEFCLVVSNFLLTVRMLSLSTVVVVVLVDR